MKSSIVLIGIAIMAISALGASTGLFAVYPSIGTLPVGSCVSYNGAIWQITGPTDHARGTVPIKLIGYADGHTDLSVGTAIDGATATDQVNFAPLPGCNVPLSVTGQAVSNTTVIVPTGTNANMTTPTGTTTRPQQGLNASSPLFILGGIITLFGVVIKK